MASRSYIMALGLAGATVVAAASVAVAHPGTLNDWPYAASTGQVMAYTLATVGDIACEPNDPENAGTPAALKCGSAALGGLAAEYATAQQADAMRPDLVALLGDEQYQVGKLSDFEQSFEQARGGLLYQARATLVLNGHEHYYARFRPMNPAGQYDPRHGILQITVGTGGEALDTLATEKNGSFSNPNVVTAQDQALGVMKLTLHPHGYSWDYEPALAGPGASATAMSYSDSGSAACRG